MTHPFFCKSETLNESSISLSFISLPVLTGKSAERFLREVERVNRLPKRVRLVHYYDYIDRLLEKNSRNFKGLNVGSQVLNCIKDLFTHPANKTGYRFLIVDALNEDKVIEFYRKNGFILIYDPEQYLRQRFMCCDLLR